MLKQRRQFLSTRKKTRKPIFFKILFYLVLLAFVGTIIYVLFFSPMLKIVSVKISGSENIGQNLLLEKINFEIAGKHLGLIEKNNLLLVKTDKIKRNLLAEFKGIREIEITRKFPDGLEIKIKEKIPNIIFCEREKCLILDEFGEAYDWADSFLSAKDRNTFLRIIDESGKTINLGEVILDREYISYVQNIKKEINRNFNFELENEVRTPSVISNNIKLRTKLDWDIYFNREISAEREIEMLKIILKNNFTSEQQIRNLEYIDLRIDGKIFYKYRDDTPEGLARKAEVETEKEGTKK